MFGESPGGHCSEDSAVKKGRVLVAVQVKLIAIDSAGV